MRLFIWYWAQLVVAPFLLLIPIAKLIELEPPLGPTLLLIVICMTVVSLLIALNEGHKVNLTKMVEALEDRVRNVEGQLELASRQRDALISKIEKIEQN